MKYNKHFTWGFIGVLTVCAAISLYMMPHVDLPTEKAAIPSSILTPEQRQFTDGLVRKKFIDVDLDRRRIFVDPDLWFGLPARQKEDLVAGLAGYMADLRHTSYYSISVLDMQSGKELATFSGWTNTVTLK